MAEIRKDASGLIIDKSIEVSEDKGEPYSHLCITGVLPAHSMGPHNSVKDVPVSEDEEVAGINVMRSGANPFFEPVEQEWETLDTEDSSADMLLVEQQSIAPDPLLAVVYQDHTRRVITDKPAPTIYRVIREEIVDEFSRDENSSKTNTVFHQPWFPSSKTATPLTALVQDPPKITADIAATPIVLKLRLVNGSWKLQNDELPAEKLVSQSLQDGGARFALPFAGQHVDYKAKEDFITSQLTMEATSAQERHQQQKSKPFCDVKVPDWDELAAAFAQMQPLHTGKQGMATFNNQKVLTVERLKDLHSSLKTRPAANVLADDPDGLTVALMYHQKHALAWMTWRERQKPRGGILADDMGLGKTLAMISLVITAKARGKDDLEEIERENSEKAIKENKDFDGGTLVVCPASLLRQWENEVHSKLSQHMLTVYVHHGSNRETRPKQLSTYDMVVTTYNIVARENATQAGLFGVKWRRIMYEAHVIRNHKAMTSVAACSLRGKYRWALTGTPVQNKEMDVYALLKFLRCTPFDDLNHWKLWIDNIDGGQQRLNIVMNTLMLRRTKVQLQAQGALLCLPERRTELIEFELDKEEMNVYQKVMTYSRTLFAQFLDQRDHASRPTIVQTTESNGTYYKIHEKLSKIHRDQGREQIKSHHILVLLLRLRQICCHPGLIDAMLEDENTQHMEDDADENVDQDIDLLNQLNKLVIEDTSNGSSELLHEEQVMAKATAKVLQRDNPVFDLKRPSSKMNKVLETLRRHVLSTKDKAIVVSQWTSVLNILKEHLEKQGIVTLSLNGTIPVKNRQDIVTQFNDAKTNKRVLLLSLTAGGVGLNLIGANHLFLFNLHWNPQALQQHKMAIVEGVPPCKIK